jgi:hypothetical protein
MKDFSIFIRENAFEPEISSLAGIVFPNRTEIY